MTMRKSLKFAALAALGLGLVATGALAADVMHNGQDNARSPFASSVYVPAGYDTYYISGSAGKGADTAAQTAATLDSLKAQLAKLGLTFGDVVQAHVFLVGDANKGGKMDFAGMNSSWFKEFGTADQPNKPARAAFQVAALAGADNLVEIEFIAVKKAH
jgi:enamine deaminase RidA (YjgF/YER057c/UK114 family)